METDALGMRKAPGEGPEPRERHGGLGLRESADRSRDLGFRVPWRQAGRGRELTLGRDRAAQPLQRRAVEQLRTGVTTPSLPREQRELARRR